MNISGGGDPRYGNEQFLQNTAEWAASVIDYPEYVSYSLLSMIIAAYTMCDRFIDFGAPPCFIGLWELASSQSRRNELEAAYTQFVQDYKTDLESPGPYLTVRMTTDMEDSATIAAGNANEIASLKAVALQFPPSKPSLSHVLFMCLIYI